MALTILSIELSFYINGKITDFILGFPFLRARLLVIFICEIKMDI